MVIVTLKPRRAITRILVTVVVLAGLVGLSASSATAAPSAAKCADVLLLGARGTAEYGPGSTKPAPWPKDRKASDYYGLGAIVNSFRTSYLPALSGQWSVMTESVDYNPTDLGTLFSNPDKYFANLQKGVDWALNFISAQVVKCPNQVIVLAGYSQGAMIMHRLVHELGTKILSRISAVVLTGDGDQVSKDRDTRYGTAPTTSVGIGSVYPAISLYNAAKFTQAAGARVLSVCDKNDPVCDWRTADVPCLAVKACRDRLFAIHQGYPGTKPLAEAAKEAASMTRASLLGTAWTPAEVTGADAVTCPSTSTCVAAGLGPSQVPAVQTWSSGTWTSAQLPLPADADYANLVQSVACGSPPLCTVTGTYYTLSSENTVAGFLDTLSSSGWTVAKAPVPAGSPAGESVYPVSAACPSGSSCVVAGWAGKPYSSCWTNGTKPEPPAGSRPLLWTMDGTTWTVAALPLPKGAGSSGCVDFVTCPTVTSCIATGTYQDTSGNWQALLEIGSGHNWTAIKAPLPAHAVRQPDAVLNSVACSSATSCVAVGWYIGPYAYEGLIESGSGTLWKATTAPVPANGQFDGGLVQLYSVACAPRGLCVAVGQYQDQSGNSLRLLVAGSGSQWTGLEGQLPVLRATDESDQSGPSYRPMIACPATSACVAIGSYEVPPNDIGYFETGSGTTWTDGTVPLPADAASNPADSTIESVACASPEFCVVTGYYDGTHDTSRSMIATGPA